MQYYLCSYIKNNQKHSERVFAHGNMDALRIIFINYHADFVTFVKVDSLDPPENTMIDETINYKITRQEFLKEAKIWWPTVFANY